MRTLIMSISTWFLVFHSLCGVLAKTGSTAGLIVRIGRCSLNFNAISLSLFHECLCAGFQKCSIQPRYRIWSAESHHQTIRADGERIYGTDSSTIHYMCEATCSKQLFSYKVDPLTCRRVNSDESESGCKERPKCNNIRTGFTEKSYCERCIDVRWSKPDEIKVSIGNHDIFQHGQCPRENETTTLSTLVETSVDLSMIFSNGSTLQSNATTTSGAFPRKTFTEASTEVSDNGSDNHLVRLVIPLVLAIFVFAIAATALCIIYRRRCKLAVKQDCTDIYITPLDVTYSSSEYLAQGPAGGNGLSSALDRSSNIYIARENEYADVSFPDSCSRGLVQTSDMHAGACLKTSVHENAEKENVYTDLGKTARTTEASNRAHYANTCSVLPNISSTTATTSHRVTDTGVSNDNRLSQVSRNESNYSTINDCAERTDHTLKHCSSKCENASFVCNDVEGAYKIMRPTATNLSDNTKNSHDSSSSGTKLFNNSMYTRLRENPEQVSNVYDDLVTESEDVPFKSAFLSSSLGSEGEYISVYCPLHKKHLSEEDRLNGNVYENHGSGLNAKGSYVNNAMISDARTTKSIYNNCEVDEDKALEPGSLYVNYTDPGVEQAPSPSACNTHDALTNKHMLANGYSTVRGCGGNNSSNVCSCDGRE